MSKKNEQIYAVQIVDKDKVGLHARPVAKICGVTNNQKYKDITVEVVKLKDDTDLSKKIVISDSDKKANGKSILSFIGLAVKNQNKIAFVLKGDNKNDIEEIINGIEKVLKTEGLIS